jgi:hypothetical protein
VSPRPTALGVLAAVCCLCAVSPSVAPAQAAQTSASIRPYFSPDRLGARTAFTLAFKLSGGEEGVPAPLSAMVVRLPAGLGIDERGVEICAKSRLQRRGPSGCPAGSLVGRGHALMSVHAGSLAVPEEATITAFRGPNRSGRPTIEIFGQGETPLDQSAISTGVLERDSSPYGSKLTVSIPPIPTLMLEPNASVVSESLTIGGSGIVGRGGGARRRRSDRRATQLPRGRVPIRGELHIRRRLHHQRFRHPPVPVGDDIMARTTRRLSSPHRRLSGYPRG